MSRSASVSHLAVSRAPYVLYGVNYIDRVSVAPFVSGITVPPGAGGSLFFRGPASLQHVPGDTHFFLQGGKLVVDIGWDGTLFAQSRLDDGKPHSIAVRYTAGVLSVFRDGALDGSVVLKVSAGNGDGWAITVGGVGLGSGVVLTSLTYAQLLMKPVQHLSFNHITFSHVGWGLGRAEHADFQVSAWIEYRACLTEYFLYFLQKVGENKMR